MSFDWRTEQDEGEVWEEEPKAVADGDRPRRARRWSVVLLAAILLLVAAFLVRREAQRRLDEAAATVEEEVVSSHRLGLQAAQRGDDELFVTLLSGREPSWTEVQKALLEAGFLYQQAGRLFGLQPAGEPQVVDVSFSPDLRAAELRMTQAYHLEAAGSAENVELQRTFVYREGQQRWLLSPPEPEFWGSRESVTHGSLTVDYPARDEEVVQRLARDLSAMLAEMCQTLEELECAPGWWMRLRLEKDPDSLLALGEAEAAVPNGPAVTLPTPSLVGVPADAEGAAYEALLRGYARHLAAAAIGDLVGWDCCGDGVLFYQALLEEQLAQIGLGPEPATRNDYLYLIDEGVVEGVLFEVVNDYWREPEPVPIGEEVPTAVHAFLAYLRDEGLASPASAMQRSLSTTEPPSLLRWLEPTDPMESVATVRNEVSSGFRSFVWRRMQEASEQTELPEGLSLPHQDLLLACGGSVGDGGLDLYRYDLASGSISLEAELNAGYVQMVGGAAHATVAVLAFNEGSDELDIRNFVWRPDGGLVTVAGPDGPETERIWMPLSYGPNGELAVFLYTLPAEESQPSAGLVDVESCRPGGCGIETLPGLPIWSPSGDHMLAQNVFQEEILLYLRTEGDTDWKEVARAWAPTWIDDDVYAYIPYSDEVRLGSLWATTVSGGEGQRLVSAEELRAALPSGISARRVTVSWASPDPRDERRLYVGARAQSGGGLLLFSADRATGATSWLEGQVTVTFVDHLEEAVNFDHIGGWFGAQDIVSPDGQWLLVGTGPPDPSNSGILLYDLQNRETVLRSRAQWSTGGFFGQSSTWSPDGAWLVRPVAGVIDVLAPSYEVDGRPYRRLIVHDFEICSQAIWIGDG